MESKVNGDDSPEILKKVTVTAVIFRSQFETALKSLEELRKTTDVVYYKTVFDRHRKLIVTEVDS